MAKDLTMSKIIITIGYTNYVMEMAGGLKVLEALAEAERFEEKWHKQEEGGTTYHVWEPEQSDLSSITTVKLLSPTLYKLAKLAGKPTK